MRDYWVNNWLAGTCRRAFHSQPASSSGECRQRMAHCTAFSIVWLIALVPATSLGRADSIPMHAVNKASGVIDQAIEAYGGANVLQDIRTVTQHALDTNFATQQSREPGPPWDKSQAVRVFAVDFANEIAFTSNKGQGSGFITDSATVIRAQGSANIDRRQNTLTPITDPDFYAAIGPSVRVTPLLLVRELMQRRHTSHWLGETNVDGAMADIVTLVMQVGPALALYVDRKTGLLVRAERMLAPSSQVEYRFEDYKVVNGLPLNQGFKLFVNGELNMLVKPGLLTLNEPIDEYLRLTENLVRVTAPTPDVLNANKLADGVYLIGGAGTYAMFVEVDGFVIAIGGTAGIPERIDKLRAMGVNKPVRYGLLTHHHNDHLLGVGAYQALQAQIIGHATHAEVIRQSVDGPIDLIEVRAKHVLGSGSNFVEIYDIGPTPHARHVLVAYLPEHKILFQADHSGIARSGPVGRAQPVAVALVEAVQRLGLEVEHFVGAHSPRVLSQSDLAQAVRAASAPEGERFK